MNILIIGGTGVLSRAVASEAIKQGIKVSILHRGTKLSCIPEGTDSIIADATNDQQVKTALKEKHFDTLIDFISYNKTQIKNSFNIFHKYTNQYVFISTACVYNTSIPGVKDEDAPKVLKEWNYSNEKWTSELFLMNAAKKVGIAYTIIRPAVTYDDTRIPYGITPAYGYHWTIIGRILANKPVIIWDGGKAKWNIMRVEDFAVGVTAVVGNRISYNQTYNVSGDDAYSWKDVLETVSICINHPIIYYDLPTDKYISMYPSRKGEIKARSLDTIISNSKIKEIAPSFSTRISLKEGVENVVKYYRENNYGKGIDYRFDAEQDRIIRKSNTNNKEIRTGFVDYTGAASFSDRLDYYVTYSDSKIIRFFINIIRRFWNKIN